MNQYKWRYRDDERPQGSCYDCGLEYSNFPDMMIPDDLWERINPTEHEGAGILCPTCIARRLDHLGLWYKDDLFKLKRSKSKKQHNGETIVLIDGIFHSSTIKESIDCIYSLYPNRKVIIHMILPGMAYITVFDQNVKE